MNSCPSGYFNCAKSDGSSIVGKPVFGCSDECTLGEGRRLGASQVQTSAAISMCRPSMRVTTAALFEMSQLQFDLHLQGVLYFNFWRCEFSLNVWLCVSMSTDYTYSSHGHMGHGA